MTIVATEKGERMMATCKDCLHEKVCVWNAELEEACNDDCSDFKNKADYAEVKHGAWGMKTHFCAELMFTGFICSICGRESAKPYNYCHGCGAKMDGRSDGDGVDKQNERFV